MALLNWSETDCQPDILREHDGGMQRMTMICATLRSVIIVFALAAWFGLSNHCALGLTAASPASGPAMEGCPMHTAPAKKKPAAKTPCCKEVRAVVAKTVGKVLTLTLRNFGRAEYAPEILVTPPRTVAAVGRLDTGPPGLLSFAESVLQESMLSHAPPVS